MSRLSPRVSARITVTTTFAQKASVVVCKTRNVSGSGLFLECPIPAGPGTAVEISLLDADLGEAIALRGDIVRMVPPDAPGGPNGLGVQLAAPPEQWNALVARMLESAHVGQMAAAPRRLRVLIVGDGSRRKAALKLYVTSGWDVRFASDHEVEEALAAGELDAVVVERDLEDPRWREALMVARRVRPMARRVIRCALEKGWPPPPGRENDLVHRVVPIEGGIEALVEAVAVTIPMAANALPARTRA